jgi:hypothetical protein
MAVGSISYYGTLAEDWNGTSWSIKPTPNLTGGYSWLTGVSCTSATACTAVGYSYSTAGEMALVERWNGTTWSIQTTPNLTGSISTSLNGVSCTSITACTAVGTTYNGTVVMMLVERWNGTSWSIQSTPSPPGATRSELYGVSCTSSTACTAVGYFENSAKNIVELVERWNGTTWSIQSTPAVPESSLSGVSCTSTTACTAVGTEGSGTLAEGWNGTSWSLQSTPTGTSATSATLNGVSCTSANLCTAVWSSIGTLAERWNGTSWSIQPTPNPTGATYSSLNAVSCTSTNACTAVGGSSLNVLVERYS